MIKKNKNNFLEKEDIINFVLSLESSELLMNNKCMDKNILMDQDCVTCPSLITFCMLGREENPKFPFINLYQAHEKYEDTVKRYDA